MQKLVGDILYLFQSVSISDTGVLEKKLKPKTGIVRSE